MGSGIDPKVDLAFKRVFGSPENAFVLKHLLNAVLSGSRPPLAEVEVLNPFSQQDGLSERKLILDIKARDEQGHEFLIEMQISLHPAFAERLLLYAAKTYSQQLAEGEGYNLLRPVTVVCFLNAVLFPDVPEYHGCYELRETTTHRRFSNHWQFHVVELPKFHTAVNDVAVDLERWTYFLQHGAEFDPDSLPPQLRIPEIVKATETLTMLSHTDQERELYEARLRYQRDEEARLRYSQQQGMQQGEVKGLVVGAILNARETLLRLGQIRFKTVPPAVTELVNAIDDKDRLAELTDRILDAADWTSLFPSI